MLSAEQARDLVKARQQEAAEELRRATAMALSVAARQGKSYISMETAGVSTKGLSEFRKELEGLGYEVVKSYSGILVKW